MWVDYDVRRQQEMDVFTEESIIMDYELIYLSGLLKHLNDGFDSF